MFLTIKHSMEVAHRLYVNKGKCENIHGHSMRLELNVFATIDSEGMAVNKKGQKLEYGAMKKAFRTYIDETYDHHLLLNQADPFAGPIVQVTKVDPDAKQGDYVEFELTNEQSFLPGLVPFEGDPTVENIAKVIGAWAAEHYRADVELTVHETSVNGATVHVTNNNFDIKVY